MSNYLKSLTEAAALLGTTRQAAWGLYRRGRFPNSGKIGNFIVIPLSDIEAVKQQPFKEAFSAPADKPSEEREAV